MTGRYALDARTPGKSTGVAEPVQPTPGKATLTQRLVQRGLAKEEVVALIEAATRGGAPAPAAVAARSAYGAGLRVHQGGPAAELAEAAATPVVVVDEHVVVGATIDPSSQLGEAALAQAITAAPAGQMTAAFAGDDPERSGGGRPTPPWPNGPMTNYKETPRPLADYLALLRDFEQIHGSGGDAVQRLRRLHYSAPCLGAGGKFDGMIDTSDTTMPTSPPLAQATIDGLYATKYAVTPTGGQVDVSHVFALFDLLIAGRSLVGIGADQITPLEGLFTWTGDLASWFTSWLDGQAWLEEGGDFEGGEGAPEGGGDGGEGGAVEGGGEGGGLLRRIFDSPRNRESPTDQLAQLEVAKARCEKDDLLGNMDAHALKAEVPQVAAGARSLADMLESYYGKGAATGVDRRFHRFVASAVPAIPFTLVTGSPLTVQLAPSASQAIYDALLNAIRSLRMAPIGPLEGHTMILGIIAQRFTDFLRTGLATGDAPW